MMFQPEEIFWSRMRSSWQHRLRVLSIVFQGGGAPILLLVLILGFIFGYQYFLQWLPADFPIELVIALFLTWFLQQQAVLRTWLKQADLTFLLPAEGTMKRYIFASGIYSSTVGLIQTSFFLLILSPLYVQRFSDQLSIWWWGSFLVVLFLWNLYVSWLETRWSTLPGKSGKGWTFFRTLLNFWLLLISLWVTENIWLFSLAIPVLYTFFLHSRHKQTLFPWAELLEQEENKTAKDRRLAEMFVDLPSQAKKIVPRKRWIALWNRIIPISKQSLHLFLFSRILFRDREVFSQYLLLTGWSLLLGWAIPFVWTKYLFFLLALIFWKENISRIIDINHFPLHYRLLPKSPEERVESQQKVIFSLTLIFTLWLSLLFGLTGLLTGLWSLLAVFIGFLYGFLVRQQTKA